MQSKLVEIDLNTVCEGSLPELFNRELQNVLRNIRDINTEETTKREINIKFVFEPMEETSRTKASIDLKVSSKLAPTKPVRSSLMIDGSKAIEQQVVPSSNPDNVRSLDA